jgi:Flp pilus assembly protein TadB
MHALAYVLYFASFYLAFESTATKHWTRLRIVHVLVPVQKQQASASFPSRMAKKPHSRKQHFSVALCTADFLDAIERSIHTGHSLRAAVNDGLPVLPAHMQVHFQNLALHCRIGAPLEEVLMSSSASDVPDDVVFGLQAIVAASAGGVGTRYALERASWVLRERHSVSEERRLQSAQALFSARILSWLPLAFGSMMVATNANVRNVLFTTPVGFLCCGVGAVLNFVGRWWMKKLAHRKIDAATSAFIDFIDLLVVLLKSGNSTQRSFHAMSQWSQPIVRTAATEILAASETHTRFVDALPLLINYFGTGATGVVNALAASERDGLPLAPLLERLSHEAHNERRRIAQEDAAKLPIRLSFPLVVCVLPSFVTLTIVPILVGALSSLTLS